MICICGLNKVKVQLTVREVVEAARVPRGAELTSADLLCELGCV